MASSNEQNKPIRMSRPFGSINTEKADAVQTNSKALPTREQITTRVVENTQRNKHYNKLKQQYPELASWDYEALDKFDKGNSPVSINGKVIYPVNYKDNRPQISKDTKTEQQHKQAQANAQQKLQESKELTELEAASEVINHPDNPIGWIPGVRTMFNIGADQRYSHLTGENYTPYTIPAGLSVANDVILARFGLGGWKPYAGSYVGSVVGGAVGDQYNYPNIGRIIGGIAGGVAANELSNFANQAIGTYNYFNNLRKFGNTFKNSVKDTKFTNKQVETVSKNGMTIGSALERGSEGLHFSPEGSPTSFTIQNSMGYPHKRIGTFTYTNNTTPIETTDVGYFGKGFNPMFDKQVDSGHINFWYPNGFEGNNNISFLTTEPHFGIQLSKNIYQPYKPISFLKGENFQLNENYLSNRGGVRVYTPEEATLQQLNGFTQFGDFPLEFAGGAELTEDAYQRFIKPTVEELIQYWNSGDFARRLSRAGLLSKRQAIIDKKIANLENTRYGVNTDEDIMGSSYGHTIGHPDITTQPIVEFNGNETEVSLNHAVGHEATHASNKEIDPEITQHNMEVLADIWDNIRPEVLNDSELKKHVQYLITIDPYLGTEISGQLANAIKYMEKNNLTVDQLLNDTEYIATDIDLLQLLMVLKPQYVRKLLSKDGIIADNSQTNNLNYYA